VKGYISGILTNVDNGQGNPTSVALDNVVAFLVIKRTEDTVRTVEIRICTMGLDEADVLHLEAALRESSDFMRSSPMFEQAQKIFQERYGRPFVKETISEDSEFRRKKKGED
jgi:hypothetical protein